MEAQKLECVHFECIYCLNKTKAEIVLDEDGKQFELAFQVMIAGGRSKRIFQQTSGKSGSAECWLHLTNFIHLALVKGKDNYVSYCRRIDSKAMQYITCFGHLKSECSLITKDMCESRETVGLLEKIIPKVEGCVREFSDFLRSEIFNGDSEYSEVQCEGIRFDSTLYAKSGFGILILELCKGEIEDFQSACEELKIDIDAKMNDPSSKPETLTVSFDVFLSSLSNLEGHLIDTWKSYLDVFLTIPEYVVAEADVYKTAVLDEKECSSADTHPKKVRRARRSSSASNLLAMVSKDDFGKSTEDNKEFKPREERESLEEKRLSLATQVPQKELPPIPNMCDYDRRFASSSKDRLESQSAEHLEHRDSVSSLVSVNSLQSDQGSDSTSTPKKGIKGILKLFSPSGRKKVRKTNSLNETTSQEIFVTSNSSVSKSKDPMRVSTDSPVFLHRKMASDLSMMSSSGSEWDNSPCDSRISLHKNHFYSWQTVVDDSDTPKHHKRTKGKLGEGSSGNLFKSPASRKKSSKKDNFTNRNDALALFDATSPSDMGSQMLDQLLGELDNFDWTDIMDIKADIVAKELTLIDAFNFSQLKEDELTNCAWMKKETKSKEFEFSSFVCVT